MPIGLDFPEITDAFRQFLLLPVRQIAHSFEALAQWLEKRVKLADALEQSSREYPVIRFEGDAVMLRLDRIQAGALASDSKPTALAEHVGKAGQRFVTGLSGIPTAIEQEWAVPGAFGAAATAIAEIAGSVERFAHPPSEMAEQLFGHPGVAADDPLRRRAGDLWGEAALIWRTVAGSTGQLKGLVTNIGEAMKLFAGPAVANPAPAPGTDSIEAFGRYILAALILLPQIPAFAKSLWDSLVIVVKTRMIDAFTRIEARINGIRAAVITFFFVDLRGILRQVLSYAMAAQIVLLANIRFFGKFALDYGALAIAQLKTWFDAVAAYLNKYIGYVNAALTALNAILQFNVAPLLAGPLALALPEITVDDLITVGTDLARAEVRVALSAAAEAANLAAKVQLLLPGSVKRRIAAIPTLIWNALRPPPPYPAETARLAWPPGYGFPRLYDTIFGPGIKELRTAIDGVAGAAPRGARDILGAGAAALDVLGDEFAAQAEHAAQMGSADRFRALAATADRQARDVFGGDAERLCQSIAARPPDAVAAAFESWLALSFHTLGEVIPAYARQLRELWQEKAERGEEATVRIDMTSPRILAEHATLAGVSVREVLIDATAKPVNRDLVAEIARQFKWAVQQAYVDGQKRLRLFAASVTV
jgi:hypothetical protein